MSEISQLVSEYNQVEEQQNARLSQICALLNARKGPRLVVVADQAVRDFTPMAVSGLLSKLNRGISKCEEGLDV